MKETTFSINGMSCEHCVRAVEKELAELNIDFYEVEIGQAKVKYDVTRYEDEDIIRAIHEAGYDVLSKK
jgi:copper chaperone